MIKMSVSAGKSGKFLDEERLVSDYPLMDPVAYLELRYKRRVYRMVNVDEKQIKQLHTRVRNHSTFPHLPRAISSELVLQSFPNFR